MLSNLFSFSLTSSIMLKLHVKVQWSFRAIEFVTSMIRTNKTFVDFICTTSKVLLSTTGITLIIILALLVNLEWLSFWHLKLSKWYSWLSLWRGWINLMLVLWLWLYLWLYFLLLFNFTICFFLLTLIILNTKAFTVTI